MVKNQIIEGIWYAVLSGDGYITHTSRSKADAEKTANPNDDDDVIILNSLDCINKAVDNGLLP